MIPIFTIFNILHLFNFNLNNKLRIYDEFIKKNHQYLNDKLKIESIDQDTANQEHEYDELSIDFKSLKKFLEKSHKNQKTGSFDRNTVGKNTSEEVEKVAIKFRLTSIYRIGIYILKILVVNFRLNSIFQT